MDEPPAHTTACAILGFRRYHVGPGLTGKNSQERPTKDWGAPEKRQR